VLIVVLALGAWLIPMTTPGSPQRIAAWAVAWIAVFGAVAWAQRRRS
jgi:MYXO-CTERM domain-containing protein